jgi:hypothetical protein
MPGQVKLRECRLLADTVAKENFRRLMRKIASRHKAASQTVSTAEPVWSRKLQGS